MSQTENRKLEPEDLEKAAAWRFTEGLTWEHIAARLKCDRMTLLRWRKREEWENAKAKVIATVMQDAPTAAWAALERKAREGDVAACKEILARTEGPISQKHDVQVEGEVDHNVKVSVEAIREQAPEVCAILDEVGAFVAGEDGESGEAGSAEDNEVDAAHADA